MGRSTGISWTDATFNHIIGCQKVSPGCANCYAEVDRPATVSKALGLPLWGGNGYRRLTSRGYWKHPLRWNKQAEKDGKPMRVFCASQADVFEDYQGQLIDNEGYVLWIRPGEDFPIRLPKQAVQEARPCLMDNARELLFRIMEDTPHLRWQVLTKRPENILRMVPEKWLSSWPSNVWAMTSVENQALAEKRIPELLKVPAKIRGLSVEPLLGLVDLTPWLREGGIHWVILGGESGPSARLCLGTWLECLVDQCATWNVPVFVKQLGFNTGSDVKLKDKKGGDMDEWVMRPKLQVRQFPREEVSK